MTSPKNDRPDRRAEQSLLLQAYVDDELDPVNAIAIEQRVESDPAAAAEVAGIMALRRAIRDKFPPEPVPPELLARINRAVGSAPSKFQPSWNAIAASVLLALAVGSGSTWLSIDHVTPRNGVADLALASHMRALMAPATTDVRSSERHTVKPWFNGRVSVAPRVVDLAGEGFPLIGGRVDVFGTHPVPTLVYARRLHVISLYAIPASQGGNVPTRSINGYNIVSWIDGATIYCAVSDLNATELESFARMFRTAPG